MKLSGSWRPCWGHVCVAFLLSQELLDPFDRERHIPFKPLPSPKGKTFLGSCRDHVGRV